MNSISQKLTSLQFTTVCRELLTEVLSGRAAPRADISTEQEDVEFTITVYARVVLPTKYLPTHILSGFSDEQIQNPDSWVLPGQIFSKGCDKNSTAVYW